MNRKCTTVVLFSSPKETKTIQLIPFVYLFRISFIFRLVSPFYNSLKLLGSRLNQNILVCISHLYKVLCLWGCLSVCNCGISCSQGVYPVILFFCGIIYFYIMHWYYWGLLFQGFLKKLMFLFMFMLLFILLFISCCRCFNFCFWCGSGTCKTHE